MLCVKYIGWYTAFSKCSMNVTVLKLLLLMWTVVVVMMMVSFELLNL